MADLGIAFGRNSSVVSAAVVSLETYLTAVPFMTAGGADETEPAAERSLTAERLAEAAAQPLPRRTSAAARWPGNLAERGFGKPAPRM